MDRAGLRPTGCEGDLGIGDVNQSGAGDGDTMGVASQVLDDLFCIAKGAFGEDNPWLSVEFISKTSPAGGVPEDRGVPVRRRVGAVRGICLGTCNSGYRYCD